REMAALHRIAFVHRRMGAMRLSTPAPQPRKACDFPFIHLVGAGSPPLHFQLPTLRGRSPLCLIERCARYATSASVALAPDLNEDRLGKRSAHQKNREERMQRLLCGFAGYALALLMALLLGAGGAGA